MDHRMITDNYNIFNYYTFVHKEAFRNFESLQEKHNLDKNYLYRCHEIKYCFNINLAVALETLRDRNYEKNINIQIHTTKEVE